MALGAGVANGATQADATQATGVVTVTGEAGAAIVVTFTGSGGTPVTRNLTGTGSSQAVALTTGEVTTLGDGPVSVSATQTDAAGNAQTAPAATTSFTLDTSPPTAPTLALGTGVANGATQAEATQATGVVTVAGESGAAIVVTFTGSGGTPVTRNLTGTGASQPVVLNAGDVTTLGDGLISVSATQTDAAGNAQTVPAATTSFTLDTGVPATPTLALGTGVANGATQTEATQASGVVTVTGESGAAIVVTFTGSGGTPVTRNLTGTGASQPVVLNAGDVTTLGDGTVSVTATQTDAAGNTQTAPAATTSFTLDTGVPAAPTLALGTGVATNGANLTEATQATGVVTVAGESGAAIVVTFTRGANTVTKNLTGTGSSQAVVLTTGEVTTLGDGPVSVSATQTDAAGNPQIAAAATISFTLDATTPAAPTLALGTGVANGATQAEATQATGVVTVAGESGAAIVVTFTGSGGTPVTKNLTGTGSSQAVALTTGEVTTLGDGPVSVSATQTDAAGNAQTVPAATTSFTLDTSPPTAPTLALGTGVANGATQAEATQATGVVTVAGESGAAIVVTFTGSGGTPVTKNLTGTGSSQAVVLTTGEVTTLGDGPVSVSATQTDAAGNAQTAPAATTSFTLDTSPPTAPTLALGTGVANGATQAEATQVSGVVTVTGESGTAIVVTFTRGTNSVTKNLTGTGATQAVELTSGDVTTLGDGLVNVSATQTDTAGNAQTAPAATTSFTLDTSAPTAPTLALGTGVTNGATQAEATQATGVITVTGESGAAIIVTFTRGSNTVTKNLTGTGVSQPVVLTTGDVTTLGDGLVNVSATQTDAAGNFSTASESFTLDTAAPNPPVIALGAGVTDGATSTEAQQFSGVVVLGNSPAGLTVTVVFTGQLTSVSKTFTSNGGASQPVILTSTDVSALGDGTVSVSATQADAAGNASSASTIVFMLDTDAPAAPTLLLGTGIANGATQPEALQASGVVTTIGINGAPLTITFTGPNGSVTKSLTGTGASQPVLLSAGDVTTLGDGSVSVSATQADSAGNSSPAASRTFTLDTSAPAAPTLALGAGVANGATQAEATQATGVVTVTGEAGAAIVVTFTRSGGTPVTKNLTGTGASQAVVLTAGDVTTLGDGLVNVSAAQTDTAGNAQTAPAATTSFTLDTAAPTGPTLALGTGVANGATQAEGTQATGVVTVTGEAGAAIVVTFTGSGGTPVTKNLTGTGASQAVVLTAGDVTTLGDGSVSATATQTDTAGNAQTAPAATTSFTLDTGVPTAPTLALGTGVANGATQAEATQATGVVTVTGEAGAAIVVTFTGSGGTPVTKNLTGTGASQAVVLTAGDVTTLGDGTVSVTATQTDAAGNTQTAPAATTSFTLDTGVPAAPTLALGTGVATNGANLTEATQATGVVTVAGESGAAIVVTFTRGTNTVTKNLTGTGISQAVELNAGDVATLGDGLVNVSATQTDAAGNAQTAPAATTSFTLDTGVPLPPSTPAEQGSSKLADGYLDYVELLTPTAFRVGLGTSGAVAGDTIELLIGGASFTPAKTIVLTAGDIAAGFVDFSVSIADVGADGVKSLTARVTDLAGNVGASSTAVTFTKDTVSPVPREIGTTKLADGNYNIADAATATTIRVYLANSGAVVGDVLRLLVNNTPIKTVTLNVAHIFDGYVDFVVTPADLGVDGAKTLSSQLTKGVTPGPSNIAIIFIKDTVAPNAPSIPTEPSTTKLADGKLNLVEYGSSTAIRISLTNTHAVAGDVASLLLNGAPFAPAKAITLTSADITVGAVDFVVQAPDLGLDATKAISGLITDAAGNAGPASVSLVFALDTSLPAAPSSPLEVATTKFADSWLNSTEAATSTTVRVSIVGAVVNDTVELLLNGSPFTTAKIAPITAVEITQGFVLFTVSTTDLGGDGLKALSARIIDQSGNVSNAGTPPLSFTKDESRPSAPTTPVETGNTKLLDSFANSAELSTPIVIRVNLGTSNAVVGDTATLLLGGVSFTPAKNAVLTSHDLSNGFIDFSVSAADLAADGPKSITARVTDAAGNQGTVTTAALTFTKDTAAPGAPNAPVEMGTGKLTDGKYGTTDSQTDTIVRVGLGASGAVAGDRVELLLNGVPFAPASSQNPVTLGAGEVANGHVEFTLTSAHLGADGPKALSARVIDQAGNPGSPSGSLPFVKDTASPPTPFAPVEQATAKLADGNLNFADAATATWIRVGLGGTGAITGDKVDLLLNGNALSPTKSVVLSPAHAVDGFVDFLVTTADLGADGSKALAARLTDVNGASVVSASLSFIKDTQAPTAPANPSEAGSTKLADGKLNLIEAASQTTIRVSLSGTGAVAGDSLTLRLAPTSGSWPRTVVLTGTDIANSRVDFVISQADLGADGFKILSAEITDGFGNISAPSLGLVFELDTIAPAGPAAPVEAGLPKVADGSLNIADAQTPMSVRVSLGANVRANDTIELLLGGSPFATPKTVTLTPLDIAAGSVTYTVSSADLGSDGVKSIASRIIDQSGNVGAAGPALAFVKDTAAPSATVAPAERGSNKFTTDGVLSATDAVTSTVIRVNLGTSGAVVGDTLELLLGGVAFVPAKTRVLDALNISDSFVDFVVSTTDLGADGAKSISARMTDIAGNPGAIGTTPLAFVKDVTAPGAPAAPTEQGSIKLADSRLNDVEASTATTFSVALGTSGAITGDTIELLLGGARFATAKTVTLADADVSSGFVTFSVTGADLGVDGAKSLTARLTDRNSVGPDSPALAFVKDTAAPNPLVLSLVADTGTINSDGITNNGTVNVGGIEANATWQFVNDGSANWQNGTGSSFQLPAGVFPAGNVKVRQIDLAGNPGSPVAFPSRVEVDTSSPSVFITSNKASLRIDETATISFTLTESSGNFTNSDVVVTGGTLSQLVGSGTSYSATFTPFANSTVSGGVAVAAGLFTDTAGNGNTAGSLSPIIAIDTIAPSILSISSNRAALKGSETASIAFTLSELSSTFTATDVIVTGGTLSALSGSGSSYTAIFTPFPDFTGQGSVSVGPSTFTDAAGNVNTVHTLSTVISIDTVAPWIVTVTPSPAGTVRAGDVVTITATASEPVQAGSSVSVTLDTGNIVVLVASGNGTTLTGSFTIQPGQTSNGLRAIAIGLTANGTRDLAGNQLISTNVPEQGTSTNVVVVDGAVKLLTPSGFSANAAMIADRRATVTAIPVTFSSPVSGFNLSSVRLLLNGRSVSLRGARVVGSGANYVITLPARATNARGIYTLQILAGQIAATANGAAMTADQAIYWGKGRSVGIAPAVKAATFAAAAKPAPKPRAAAFRTIR